jgi:hypothetical protein
MAKAAVAGASGLVGSHLLPLLLSEYDQVAALTRRPLGVLAPNLVELDFDHDTLPDQTDAAFCCLGARIVMRGARKAFHDIDLNASVAFAHAAKARGARAFALITSVDADLNSPLYYLRIKAQAEKAIAALAFEVLRSCARVSCSENAQFPVRKNGYRRWSPVLSDLFFADRYPNTTQSMRRLSQTQPITRRSHHYRGAGSFTTTT